MDTKKEETIAELYALRAGLSVVSQCADEVKDYEKGLAELDKKIADGKAALELSEEEYNQKMEECYEFERDITFKANNDAREKFGGVGGVLKIGIPLIWGIAIIGMILGSAIAISNQIVGIVIMMIIIVTPIIALIIILVTRPSRRNKYAEKIKINYRAELNKMQVEAARFKLNFDVNKRELTQTIDEAAPTRQSCLQLIQNKTEEFKVYDKALVMQYGKFLTAADWKNVDLLIFYLETGRADDMKEALQLADRQRQTDAIVNEIKRAKECVCAEIGSGFAKMGVAMGRCFSELSKQISVQHQEVLSSLNENNNTLKNISSSVELNNALQAKANVTSDQLKDDFIYMQKRMGIIS